MAFPGRAAGVGSGVKNVTQGTSAEVLARKILIVGTYDPAKTGLTAEVPFLSLSPEYTADQCGNGSMLHRLHLKAALKSGGVETWIMPQAEAGGAAAAAGEIDFAGSTGVLAGTLNLYIAGDRVPVTVTAGMTVEDLADATVAAINADTSLNVTAAKVAVTFEVTITSKTQGTYGNDLTIALNRGVGEVTPTGVVAAITAMSGGSGLPVIANALNALGTGDNANEKHFTAVIHGYGQDTTTLDAISTYVGEGNDFTGLYSKTVGRPFRSLVGDVGAGSAGLAAAIVVSDARLEDRANGLIAVPGSYSHPAEIASQTLAYCEYVNSTLAQGDYVDAALTGVDTGDKADRWTADYDDRNTAVNNGVGTTLVKNGVVYLQDVISFYRPASIPADNNGYRDFANISTTQNILNDQRVFFSDEKHSNLIIVADVAKVTNTAARRKARDVSGQLDFVIQLVRNWEAAGWIYSADYTINLLKQGGYVTVNTAGNGFTHTIPTIYSGKGKIIDSTVEFDVSFAAVQ